MLGSGDNTTAHLEEVFREICTLEVEADGLDLKANTVRSRVLKEGQKYEGVRLEFEACLGKIRIPIQIDIGFGDHVYPSPQSTEYPTILPTSAKPRLRAYPAETVVAEKFQAMVELGIGNSRMKDFYDLWFLCRDFQFEGETLRLAIKGTFERRDTALPVATPLALTRQFTDDVAKKAQWAAFLKKGRLRMQPQELAQVACELERFLMPPALAGSQTAPFKLCWPPGGPWRPTAVKP
ncbi:nucleotidyl transferase AbiEii/AbiGii toxin family protein [Gloeobacter violaceus]|uniref:nucleotidyl transferase AbiEii/AbiGii toxin family protein n=1 Tax=Gloeobacter violaceus TaxID=33072 RepID=UPI0018D4C386|nr:nucleotidyl transferase AbiEii/AbiGii toxin family protein [Gloeobacter violaceus]